MRCEMWYANLGLACHVWVQCELLQAAAKSIHMAEHMLEEGEEHLVVLDMCDRTYQMLVTGLMGMQ